MSIRRKLVFEVGISKSYFPIHLRPKGVQEFYEIVKIRTFSHRRTDAAKAAWNIHGHKWLSLMAPSETTVRRVSLHVSSPKAGTGGILGRLSPIEVFHEKTP